MNPAACNFWQVCQFLTIFDLWHSRHLATLYLRVMFTFYCVKRQWVLRNNWPEFPLKYYTGWPPPFWGILFFLNKTCCYPSQSIWRQLLYEDIQGLVTRRACHVDSCHATGGHVTRDMNSCHKTCQCVIYFWKSNNSCICFGNELQEVFGKIWFIFEYLKLYLAKS